MDIENTDYELITGTLESLNYAVDCRIKRGWKPHGQPFVVEEKKKKNPLYARFDYYKILGQSMIKCEVTEKETS